MKRTTIFFLVILLLLITSFISHIYINNIKIDNSVANIYQDNKLIRSIDLENVTSGYDFEVLNGTSSNTIHVEQDKICIKSASCPDKICVNQGYISDGAVPIVCLPNRLVIKIEEKNNNLDTKVK